MAEHKKPPPPTPDSTDPDLPKVPTDPKRFDLADEVTVHAAPGPGGPGPPADEVTQTRSEPAKPPETMLGDSSPNLGPRGTFDDLSGESAVPSLSGLAAHPGSTALFDDDDQEATHAVDAPVSEQTETPTPVKPKGGTAKQSAHKPAKRIDIASGVNRAHKPKHEPQPMDADAFEPVSGAADFSNTTHNEMNDSFGLLSRMAHESWPVKLGLAAAIVSLTAFVFWLIFLAAR